MLVRKLEIHPEEYEDLEEARSWYEDHAVGLGNEFLDEIERAIAAVQRAPEIWPLYSYSATVFLSTAFRLPYCIDSMSLRFKSLP